MDEGMRRLASAIEIAARPNSGAGSPTAGA
jgi:hypothetical protein